MIDLTRQTTVVKRPTDEKRAKLMTQLLSLLNNVSTPAIAALVDYLKKTTTENKPKSEKL